MSRHKIEAVECDRCGEVVQFDERGSGEERHKWGRVYAANLHNQDKVGTSVSPADLCGGCLVDLIRFMDGCSLVAPDSAKAKRVKETAA